MGLMIQRARELGHPWVRVRVHVSNRPAGALYRQMGFKIREEGQDNRGVWVEMELELDG